MPTLTVGMSCLTAGIGDQEGSGKIGIGRSSGLGDNPGSKRMSVGSRRVRLPGQRREEKAGSLFASKRQGRPRWSRCGKRKKWRRDQPGGLPGIGLDRPGLRDWGES